MRTPLSGTGTPILDDGDEPDEYWDAMTDKFVQRYWADATLPIVTPADLESGDASVGALRRAMAAVSARGVPRVFEGLREIVERDVEDGGE